MEVSFIEMFRICLLLGRLRDSIRFCSVLINGWSKSVRKDSRLMCIRVLVLCCD